ncbi:hypothetical protein DY000_02025005 [Brassica cretica]|uniref:Uncharacterized protein n=1 Tax=Brassica cretica TaxID=69181 RepID=A0ABQ7E6L9_BRACR|nr:hypothetical protein DY000_02025005 [Brassica cretica]
MIHEAVTSGSLHVLITTDPSLVVSVASKFHSVSMSVYRKKWKVRVFERKGVTFRCCRSTVTQNFVVRTITREERFLVLKGTL